MKHSILQSPDKLMQKIRIWVYEYRGQFHFTAKFIRNREVQILLNAVSKCTLSIRHNSLIVECSETCVHIETSIIAYLRGQKLIRVPISLWKNVPFQWHSIRDVNEMGRLRAAQSKYKRRVREHAQFCKRRTSSFSSLFEAVLAAKEVTGKWLVLTHRAKATVKRSVYNDPDYVYQALVDLAHAARHYSDHKGLGKPLDQFLSELGYCTFVANTAHHTLVQFYKEYHIKYKGKVLSHGSHIQLGNGLAKNTLSIYIVQPRKLGDPIIIGHIDAYLPTSDRIH